MSDLDRSEMDSVREWEIQFLGTLQLDLKCQQNYWFFFIERYDYVGKLLKPGEEPTNYSDEEGEDAPAAETSDKKEK